MRSPSARLRTPAHSCTHPCTPVYALNLINHMKSYVYRLNTKKAEEEKRKEQEATETFSGLKNGPRVRTALIYDKFNYDSASSHGLRRTCYLTCTLFRHVILWLTVNSIKKCSEPNDERVKWASGTDFDFLNRKKNQNYIFGWQIYLHSHDIGYLCLE